MITRGPGRTGHTGGTADSGIPLIQRVFPQSSPVLNGIHWVGGWGEGCLNFQGFVIFGLESGLFELLLARLGFQLSPSFVFGFFFQEVPSLLWRVRGSGTTTPSPHPLPPSSLIPAPILSVFGATPLHPTISIKLTFQGSEGNREIEEEMPSLPPVLPPPGVPRGAIDLG